MSWENRIIGYDTKPANQFLANPLNWRTHPGIQREALRGEIKPEYCSVTLERLSQMGLEPKRILKGNGKAA